MKRIVWIVLLLLGASSSASAGTNPGAKALNWQEVRARFEVANLPLRAGLLGLAMGREVLQ